jgi:simple sugar transport system substrate-binding protein
VQLRRAARRPRPRTRLTNFPKTPRGKFAFINHVTTNPFFVPTQYGLQDAAALLGLPKPSFTGSETSNVPQMVSATNAAISAKASGIAIAVISATAFTTPAANAMNDGIPVVSYNADGVVGNPGTNRLAYIGQDLFVSGEARGQKIAAAMPNGGDAVGFIATPGTANIQPRIDGAKAAIKASGKNINFGGVRCLTPQGTTMIHRYAGAQVTSRASLADAASTRPSAIVAKRPAEQVRPGVRPRRRRV